MPPTPAPRPRRAHPSRATPLLVLGLLAGLLAVVPWGAAPASAATRSDVTSAWLTPRAGANEAGPRVRLGYLKVQAPGTYSATLSAQVTDNSRDAVQIASVSLLCKENSGDEDRIGTSANVFRGETFAMGTRVYFSVKDHGACFAYGSTMGLKTTSASLSSRRVRVRATLTVSGPVSSATRESKRFVYDDASRAYSGRSSLAKPHAFTHAAELQTAARRGSKAYVTGNTYLTTCISDGGSRDQTTNGRYLCTPGVIKHGEAGSLVRLRLVVRQYTPGGSVCETTIVPGSTTQKRISARRHHLPVAVKGAVTLPDNSRCGTKVRAWTEVQVLDGPAVVVHFPNTVTAYRPT
ncbi:hypothetical protein [Nocardioides plantarum]|uniref:hypothetical protein n=1 Tax=Nocardioides plantarum TaxID=29299 RepID=UPI00360E4BCD